MNSLSALAYSLVLVAFSVAISSASKLPINAAEPHTACGGVIALDENEEGIIEYKYGNGVFLDNNEMCIWTIRSRLSDHIYFKLEDANFESAYDYLNIHWYGQREYSWQEDELMTQKVRAIGQDLETYGGLAFVVLTTDMTTPSPGFQLKITGSPQNLTAEYPVKCNYTDLHYANGLEPIRYPELEGSALLDYELSTIVVTQPDPTALTNMIIKLTRFDLNEFDEILYVYEVSRTGLIFITTIRYEEEINKDYEARSFILLLRTSDYYNKDHTGFTVDRRFA